MSVVNQISKRECKKREFYLSCVHEARAAVTDVQTTEYYLAQHNMWLLIGKMLVALRHLFKDGEMITLTYSLLSELFFIDISYGAQGLNVANEKRTSVLSLFRAQLLTASCDVMTVVFSG